jgi:hypothetical protein
MKFTACTVYYGCLRRVYCRDGFWQRHADGRKSACLLLCCFVCIKSLGLKWYFVFYPEDLRLTCTSSPGAYGMPNNSLLWKQFLLGFREGILSQGGWKYAITLLATIWCSWIRASWYNSYRKIHQDAAVQENLLFHVYMKLNMFQATHCPSSGA